LRNTVGLCIFLAYDEPRVVELVRAATGWDVDEEELRVVVSRGLSMARLFNLREGMSPEDDRLPQRMHEPLLKGPLSDKRLSREEVQSIVNTYYVEQGWHPETGVPLAGTLAALGIADYAYVMENGRIVLDGVNLNSLSSRALRPYRRRAD